MENLLLGTILKTKGLKGTLKIFSSTDFASNRYKKGNKVYLLNTVTNEEKEVTVLDYYSDQGFDYVTFEEITSPEEGEKYLSYKVIAHKDELPKLKDGLYYFSDLEKCDIYENDILIGKVISVEEFNGRRSLRIKFLDKKELLLPFVKAFIKNIDIDSHRIDVTLIEGMR